jgi:hypothetical protein
LVSTEIRSPIGALGREDFHSAVLHRLEAYGNWFCVCNEEIFGDLVTNQEPELDQMPRVLVEGTNITAGASGAAVERRRPELQRQWSAPRVCAHGLGPYAPRQASAASEHRRDDEQSLVLHYIFLALHCVFLMLIIVVAAIVVRRVSAIDTERR